MDGAASLLILADGTPRSVPDASTCVAVRGCDGGGGGDGRSWEKLSGADMGKSEELKGSSNSRRPKIWVR